MKRRNFIKSALALIISTVLPKGIASAAPKTQWVIDPDTQKIIYTGAAKNGVSIKQLFEYIRDSDVKNVYNYYNNTHEELVLEHGWKVEENSIKHLNEGTLRQGAELYTSASGCSSVW